MATGRLRSHARLLHYVIQETGTPAIVERPDGLATENKYNKVPDSDVTFNVVETRERARRLWQSDGQRRTEEGVTGGKHRDDQPKIAFGKSADVQEDDHVVFGPEFVDVPSGSTYTVDSGETLYASEIVVDGTFVNDGTVYTTAQTVNGTYDENGTTNVVDSYNSFSNPLERYRLEANKLFQTHTEFQSVLVTN